MQYFVLIYKKMNLSLTYQNFSLGRCTLTMGLKNSLEIVIEISLFLIS